MTLVFSRDRSEAAIKEALFAGRTVAWFGSHLAGKEEYLAALFKAAIKIMPAHYTDDKGNRFHHVINTCDLPWKIKEKSAAFKGEVWLPRAGSAVIKVKPAVENDIIDEQRPYIRQGRSATAVAVVGGDRLDPFRPGALSEGQYCDQQEEHVFHNALQAHSAGMARQAETAAIDVQSTHHG